MEILRDRSAASVRCGIIRAGAVASYPSIISSHPECIQTQTGLGVRVEERLHVEDNGIRQQLLQKLCSTCRKRLDVTCALTHAVHIHIEGKSERAGLMNASSVVCAKAPQGRMARGH